MMAESPIPHPPSWPVVRLASVTSKIGSGATPSGGEASYLRYRNRYALVRSQNVYDRAFDSRGLAFISDEQASRLRSVELAPGDVLLNITGDGVTFGRACLMDDRILPACVNQHVSIIRARRGVAHPGYILAFLTHPTVKSYIESFNAGGSRRAITKGHIESFCLPLPPVRVQQGIAEVLGALDDKINLNRRMNQTLETMAQALFTSWFVDFGPVRAKGEGRQPVGMDAATAALFPATVSVANGCEMPSGWFRRPLGETAAYFSRGIGPSYTDDGGVLVLNQKCVRGGRVDFSRARRHDVARRGVQGRELRPGDVVVNSTGVGTLGRVAQVDYLPEPTIIVDSHVTVVRANQEVLHPLILGLDLCTRESDIEALAEGSTGQTELNRERLRAVAVLVPPRRIQEAFVSLVGPTRQRTALNERESLTLEALRDLLLPRLLSGELRVKDAEAVIAATA